MLKDKIYKSLNFIPDNKTYIIICGVFLSILISWLLSVYTLENRYTILLLIVPLASLFLLNFSLYFYILIGSLFLNFSIYYYSISELVVIFVCLSFFITYKFKINELRNDLLLPFLIFILSIIPSYFNSADPLLTISISLHLVLFFMLFTFLSVTIDDYSKLRNYLKFYLAMALLNGIHLIIMAVLTNKRVFGFAGIMYVDYVGIALVIAMMFFLYGRGNKILYALLIVLLIISLVLTQTRNAWLSTGITLFLIYGQFILRAPKIGFNRKKLILIFVIFIFSIIALLPIVEAMNPKVFNRLEASKVTSNTEMSSTISSINSFASRFFIWSTAYNAFMAHPIIGIGFYSFPFASESYYTIDPILYKLFVEDLTPHVTFITFLTETGIIGFLGFLLFLISTLIKAQDTVKRSKTKEQHFYSSLIFWLLIYTLFSMLMSDAWVAAHGIVLWGILLCFMIANRKLILSYEIQLNQGQI